MNLRNILLASTLLAGCSAESTDAPVRGPLGKADNVGVCAADTCGGPAAQGTCWCDAECDTFGDCCSNAAPLCESTWNDPVVQTVTFTGMPGVTATASIVKNDGGDAELSLVIKHQAGTADAFVVLDNDDLGLSIGGSFGTESSLAVAANGSLQIKQQNDSVGRDRWSRTLTVSYRDGGYVVSGFDYAYDDTLDLAPAAHGECSYNLLTHKGVWKDQMVTVATDALDLATLAESEKLYSCENW